MVRKYQFKRMFCRNLALTLLNKNKSKYLFSLQQESHNDKKTFSCSQCRYTGRSQRYLKFHQQKHHPQQEQDHHSKLSKQKKQTELPFATCPKVWIGSFSDMCFLPKKILNFSNLKVDL